MDALRHLNRGHVTAIARQAIAHELGLPTEIARDLDPTLLALACATIMDSNDRIDAERERTAQPTTTGHRAASSLAQVAPPSAALRMRTLGVAAHETPVTTSSLLAELFGLAADLGARPDVAAYLEGSRGSRRRAS